MTFELLYQLIPVIPGLMILAGVFSLVLRMRFRFAAMRAFRSLSEERGSGRVTRRRFGW
jgi:hypothetical protein